MALLLSLTFLIWILTSRVKVRLGEWNTETNPDCFGTQPKVCTDKPQDFGVEQAIPHREYVDGSRDRYHDIALIRMNGQAKNTRMTIF